MSDLSQGKKSTKRVSIYMPSFDTPMINSYTQLPEY